ncbi:ATP-binding protein [Desulfosarcina cetonica]|uniref:ATP-binding protein n=1 Tax=Desulfosarcina cetonica TaxID=90730 RepID=UPI001C459F80|nr:ATP-binding protein [Desulfosarcina cetonica]
MINACEAMPGGGKIGITERVVEDPGGLRHAEISVSDNGSGIPSATAKKVFDPFFTTKEDGTGLGLSIVSRIIREHDGHVEMNSVEGRGTTFIIELPIKGGKL